MFPLCNSCTKEDNKPRINPQNRVSGLNSGLNEQMEESGRLLTLEGLGL